MSAFRRQVIFEPGYNYLHETGPRRRGQHGMGIRFVFSGPEGATQFLMNTMWTPLGEVDGTDPRLGEVCHVDDHAPGYGSSVGLVHTPSGFDVGHHWRTPTYEGESTYGPCSYLNGAECFYDGSGLRADDLLRSFITEGAVAVWRELIADYRRCAENARERAAS